jgi:hypothetical protein
MVRGGAGLHTNQAGPLFLEERQHLTPPQLAAKNHTTRRINAMDRKSSRPKSTSAYPPTADIPAVPADFRL